MKGSPVDPNRIYASQTSGWFGQIIQRSDDGGKTWHQPGTPRRRATTPARRHAQRREQQVRLRHVPATGKPLTTHQWYDGTQHPWEFKRVWHLEPSLTDPDTVYAGVEDAALVPLDRRRQELARTLRPARPRHGPQWQPGAGGMCLHTIILDPSNPDRIYIAISAAGAFRTDDGGKTWKPINQGSAIRNTFPTPRLRSDTASTTSPCIPRAPTSSSCKSIGTSCAVTTPATSGRDQRQSPDRFRIS